jgi:3-hydroxyacyl-CoA dehydrogenase
LAVNSVHRQVGHVSVVVVNSVHGFVCVNRVHRRFGGSGCSLVADGAPERCSRVQH